MLPGLEQSIFPAETEVPGLRGADILFALKQAVFVLERWSADMRAL